MQGNGKVIGGSYDKYDYRNQEKEVPQHQRENSFFVGNQEELVPQQQGRGILFEENQDELIPQQQMENNYVEDCKKIITVCLTNYH